MTLKILRRYVKNQGALILGVKISWVELDFLKFKSNLQKTKFKSDLQSVIGLFLDLEYVLFESLVSLLTYLF